MFVGYSDIQEKDVYQFMHIATKKTMFSRDVIWLNKTYSQIMGISQVEYVSSEVEEEDEDIEEKEAYELEGVGHVGPPLPLRRRITLNNSWMYLKLPQHLPL
jgi:hypothetical protein